MPQNKKEPDIWDVFGQMDTKRKYYSMEEAMQEETLRKQLQNAQQKQVKQERKERAIVIGMVIVILLLCLPLLYYIKEKAEKLIKFCHILEEDPVFIIGTIAVLIPVTWVLYVLIRNVRKKQPAHLLELCIVLAGCFIMIGYIILQEIMKSF